MFGELFINLFTYDGQSTRIALHSNYIPFEGKNSPNDGRRRDPRFIKIVENTRRKNSESKLSFLFMTMAKLYISIKQ